MDEQRSFLQDDPLLEESQDTFGRKGFIENIARIINQSQNEESSSVVSLIGPWGSGKTSILNMLKKRLEEQDWIVADFNPWAPPDASSMTRDFFSTLSNAIPDTEKFRGVRDAIKKYASYATPLAEMIPFVGATTAALSDKVLEALNQEKAISEEFKEVEKKLKEIGAPIVIFVDDVDRLQADELALLLKSVRLLGKFPYVKYILSYDEKTIIGLLKQTSVSGGDEDRALMYLDKIVQLRFDIPPVQDRHSRGIFFSGLSEILDENKVRISEETLSRVQVTYHETMKSSLAQPRSIFRLLRQFAAYLPLVGPNEIDLADFLFLTYLRTFFPAIYRRAAQSINGLVYQADLKNIFSDKKSDPLGDWEEMSTIELEERKKLRREMERVFPRLVGSSKSTEEADSYRRASSPYYFKRYFYFGIPEGEMSDQEIRDFIETASNLGRSDSATGASYFDKIRRSDTDAYSVISQIERTITIDSTEGHQAFNLLVWITRNISHFPDVQAGLESSDRSIARWLRSVILRAPDNPFSDSPQLLDEIKQLVSSDHRLLHVLMRAVHSLREEGRSNREEGAREIEKSLSLVFRHCLFSEIIEKNEGPSDLPGLLIVDMASDIEGTDYVTETLLQSMDRGGDILDVASIFVRFDISTKGSSFEQQFMIFEKEKLFQYMNESDVLDKITSVEDLQILESSQMPDQFDRSRRAKRILAFFALRG